MPTEFNFGGGFIGLLTIVFVVAKIWDKISWSWWWVFSPLWISGIFALLILFIIVLVATIYDLTN